MPPVFPARGERAEEHARGAGAEEPADQRHCSIDSREQRQRGSAGAGSRGSSASAISGMRSRTPIALVLAAISTTAPHDQQADGQDRRRMNARNEPKKLMKNDLLGLGRDLAPRSCGTASSTVAHDALDVLGRVGAHPDHADAAERRPRGSIASSRYLRLNHKTSGLPRPAGITPTIWKRQVHREDGPSQRHLLADRASRTSASSARRPARRCGCARKRSQRRGSMLVVRPHRRRRRSGSSPKFGNMVLRLVVDAAEPRVVVHARRRPARSRTLFTYDEGSQYVRPGLVVHGDADARRAAREDRVERARQRQHGAHEEDRERDRQRREEASAADGGRGSATTSRGVGHGVPGAAAVREHALVEPDDACRRSARRAGRGSP